MDSILTSVKKILGIDESYTHFDSDLIMHINAVILNLKQIGVIDDYRAIENETTEWSDIFLEHPEVESIKTYIALKVRLLFDPPTNGSVKEAIEKNINELEWRINVEVDR